MDRQKDQVDASNLVLLDRAGRVRLGHRLVDGWRLVLDPPIDPEAEERLPKRRGAPNAQASVRTVVILIFFMAMLSLLALTLLVAPEVIAKRMPMSFERKLGAAYDLTADFVRCKDEPAQVALNAMPDGLRALNDQDQPAQCKVCLTAHVGLCKATLSLVEGARPCRITGPRPFAVILSDLGFSCWLMSR